MRKSTAKTKAEDKGQNSQHHGGVLFSIVVNVRSGTRWHSHVNIGIAGRDFKDAVQPEETWNSLVHTPSARPFSRWFNLSDSNISHFRPHFGHSLTMGTYLKFQWFKFERYKH
jgi:hypothetical protein